MKESSEAGKLAANMVSTEKGTYVLYRGYGLTGTDNNEPLRRQDISAALAAYYPEMRVRGLGLISADKRGHFDIDIALEGGI